MSILDAFGMDAGELASITQAPKYPKPVPGRVAHIDADFMAYQVSAESKAELDPNDPTPRKTLDQMRHNARAAADHVRQLAGAETAVLHTTHKSNKGNRDNIALLKEYQATRKERDNRPVQLDMVREWLGSGCGDTSGTFIGMNHTQQEADDGMAQAAYADPENNIVCSMDKDLFMVPGLKLCMYTYKIHKVTDAFGHIELVQKFDADGKVKATKVIGYGTKFFWAQLLMGDPADTISGCPKVPGSVHTLYDPTAGWTETYRLWIDAPDKRTADRLDRKLQAMLSKPKLCGPATAYKIINPQTSDAECYRVARECYVGLAEQHGYVFQNYRDGTPVTPTQAMLSEMKLLWMRRRPDENDVLHWLKEQLA